MNEIRATSKDILLMVRWLSAIILIILAGLGIAYCAADVEAQKAPAPPVIQWTLINIDGSEPAECAGQPGCAYQCFYIQETGAGIYEWELDCQAAIIAE